MEDISHQESVHKGDGQTAFVSVGNSGINEFEEGQSVSQKVMTGMMV